MPFFVGERLSNSPFQIILVKITAQKLKLKLEALFRFIPKFPECKPIKCESQAMFQKKFPLIADYQLNEKKHLQTKYTIYRTAAISARTLIVLDLEYWPTQKFAEGE